MRVARRCAIGTLRWAMQASKSSMKQAAALGSSVSKSSTTPSARSRAMAREGA